MFALEVANFASDKTNIILTETKNSLSSNRKMFFGF